MIGASHVFPSGHECGHRVRIDQREGEAEAYPAKYPDIVSGFQWPTCSTAGIATEIPTKCRDTARWPPCGTGSRQASRRHGGT